MTNKALTHLEKLSLMMDEKEKDKMDVLKFVIKILRTG